MTASAVSHTLARCIRPEVLAMQAYPVQPSTGLIKLDAMENPFSLPADLQAELGTRLGQLPLHRYPSAGIADLHTALAQHLNLPSGVGLVLGNGSDELISMLSVACANVGASVLSPVPSFVMYEVYARLHGLRFMGVPLQEDFALDERAMLEAIAQHQPTLIYLACPNNPTANLFDAQSIERIVQAAPGLVIIDEAYYPFSCREHVRLAWEYPHVLVMRTLSKLGLAGVRLGYLIGRTEWCSEIEKVRPPYNVSVLNAHAALFALEHAHEFERQAALIRDQRERLFSALLGLGLLPFTSQANMLLVRCDNADSLFASLKQQGVLVKNVSHQHTLLANCLRMTVGTPQENDVLISALKASL